MANPSQDPLYDQFFAVAGADQEIDKRGLQQCLTSSVLSGTSQPFSIEACGQLINMFDRDSSGKIGFNEFKKLWGDLNQWKTKFMSYDRDGSGQIGGDEFAQVLRDSGYKLSPQALDALLKRYTVNGIMPYDAFIACGERLKILTDFFRRRDGRHTGEATIQYDDFIIVTMSL